MHPNPAFRRTPEEDALALAAARGFGTLVANGDPVPLVAQVPFVLEGRVLDCHLVRSNPLARALPARAVLIAMGPDGYVSPDWYGLPDQVPTWNYVAVHLEGPLELRPQDTLRAHLDEVSAAFEGRLDKVPWTSGKMTDGTMERMMRGIVPARMRVETVRSTRKLNQNKPDDARLRAADAVAGGLGHELAELSRLMRAP